MKKNPLHEKYLIFKVKHSKDSEAYGKLYDLYVDRIYRFVFFKVNNAEDAEDITSEVFLKTWQYISTTEKRIDNLNALLYQTARNAVIDYYRAKRYKERLLSDQAHFERIMDRRNLEKDTDVLMRIERFEEHLHHLKDEYREIVILRHVEGFSIHEIATILKKSKSNVRVILHRAVKRLRELLGEE